ncbi:TetR/AcrR family transcriptional regulator [Phenylobacterium sp. LjRoot225]|uniref:TetR/AcrR family transcriptional regulator n=1 Tax=Phenylobacterium sp. LjRoot225 TaxID=3342285 RepID=UPI003ED137A4
MAMKRRMGPENSTTRSLLMDAVEAVMREQGYAALSARSVAARAGLKYQIVFYYFATMDDLLLATYRRRTESVLARTEEALGSERPLHTLWKASSDPFDASLSLEYMAMSNHNAVVRAETIAFGERIRHVVAERLRSKLQDASLHPEIFTPMGVAMSVVLMGGILGFESALGLSGGHGEVEAIVAWGLRQLEPEGAPAEGAPVAVG